MKTRWTILFAFSLFACILATSTPDLKEDEKTTPTASLTATSTPMFTPTATATSTATPTHTPVPTIVILMLEGQKTAHTGVEEIDVVIDAVVAGNPEEILQLLQFSTLGCTHIDGLGGPPKCKEGEEEGTKIEVFPFLGSEGHHSRKSEMDDWPGISATGVYAVYRVSQQTYSDTNYPAGEYAIIFLSEEKHFYETAQVTDGKILRLDYTVGSPTFIDLTQVASEIILAP